MQILGLIFKFSMYLIMMFAFDTHKLYWFLEFTLLQLSLYMYRTWIVNYCLYIRITEIDELSYYS